MHAVSRRSPSLPFPTGTRVHLAHVALLVHDYDEAIAFFTGALGFELVEDSPRTP